MALVSVDLPFARQQMERREPQVGKTIHRPAVAAIGSNVVLGLNKSLLMEFQQLFRLRRTAQRVDGRAQSLHSRGPRRRVLPPQQLLGLGGPRHQLAVEAEPVALELLPPARSFDSA